MGTTFCLSGLLCFSELLFAAGTCEVRISLTVEEFTLKDGKDLFKAVTLDTRSFILYLSIADAHLINKTGFSNDLVFLMFTGLLWIIFPILSDIELITLTISHFALVKSWHIIKPHIF